MNGAYWHIATNHIPVIAMPFIFFLLLGGLLRKSQDLIKASYVAAIVVALITIFVWKTGGPAARVLFQSGAQVERADIHEHAEAADFGLWAAEIVGALSLIGLWIGRRGNQSSRWGYFVLVVALWASTVEARVAHLGGLIRHSEIRAAPATPSSATPL